LKNDLGQIVLFVFAGIVFSFRLDYFLGVNPALPKVEHKTCFRCSYETDTSETICPRCGKTLKSSKNLRVRGGILIACGGFLIVFVTAIAGFLAYLFFGGVMKVPQAEAAKTGMMMFLIFGLLGFIVLFGILALINGIYMLKTGRRSLVLMWLMLGMVFIMIFGGACLSVFLK
jgi:uncharacterized paraquat-inducible protein A